MKMNILVLGSSGEIGTNLSLMLQSQGHKVTGVDKRENTWTDEIRTTISDLSIDNKGIPSKDYDVIVNFAANVTGSVISLPSNNVE